MADLITLQELRAYLFLPVKSDDDRQMDVMKNLIISATALIDKEVGHSVSGVLGTTQKYDGTGKRYLFLKNLPAVSITTLKQDNALIAAGDYYLDTDTGTITIRDGLCFTEGFQNWEAAYTYGEAPTNDIKLACKIWCGYLWKQIQDKRYGVSAVSHGGEQMTYFDRSPIPKEVKAILDRYRRKVF